MINELLSLTELAERSGVETRTLRSWIAQGVVPGPETVGRNARYSPAALTRARAAKAMRDLYNMSLPAIRQDLLTADDARIESYAAMAGPETESAQGEPTTPAIRPPSGTSAADYLHNLRRVGVFGSDAPASASPKAGVNVRPEPPPAVSVQQKDSRLIRLAEALERIAGARPARRKARAEVRLHIPITPDIELTIRGDQTSEEIARFEQIADLLRALLTGGAEHD
jgi:DNA-binding transcriptional MerR regulator